ncbi:putative secreted protein [Corynebacterium kutscheri]|uniref:SAF domain-containing protein n=1 Tax=Corynebacterium kutscheri TaxID=35755 RepID=UPI000F6EBD41|nr:SAF domain-containing protein [Corynebacterium kutscheri]VEH80242.1 putative secreted protein [Corynebacterium kutscheri]
MNIFHVLKQPGWQRTVLVKRIIAICLLITAFILGLSSRIDNRQEVITYRQKIAAGKRITAEDIELRRIPADLVPIDALSDSSAVIGRIVVAARTPGHIATEMDLIGSELTNSLVKNFTQNANSETINMVPLRLADPTLAGLLSHGDTVTVVTSLQENATPQIIAAGGRIIFAATQDSQLASAEPGTVLIALPELEAQKVAAASLSTPLAVVLSGDRTHPDQ